MTQDEWNIIQYIIEVLLPFRYWTLWMLKCHTCTLHHDITVYNDMFDYLDGVMRALAKKKTQCKEDLYFAGTFARQKPLIKYAEVSPMMVMLLITAPTVNPLQKLQLFTSEASEWISIMRTRLPILPNTWRCVWCTWRMNAVPNTDVCSSLNPRVYQATISSPPRWLPDLINLVIIHVICPAMMNNTQCIKLWLTWCLDKSFAQHAYWLPQRSIWIHPWITTELGANWSES